MLYKKLSSLLRSSTNKLDRVVWRKYTTGAAGGEPFTLPPLPYPKKALAPIVSEETLEYHYEKHHRTYVTKLNGLVANSPKATMTLEDLIKSEKGGIYNNAAQVWNHTFYWNCMSPDGGGAPKGQIGQEIDKAFGSFDEFKKQFTQEAVTHFGSGWAWLVKDQDKLKVISGHDAENPISKGLIPVLTCDVWEHAYYIDFRNDRAKYVEKWWDLVNWDFVSKNL
eukprot:TRINITY_DN3320_c0_g1_i1.p1 TRINITY_DN3320_c0_g1~~TRINITY_DN3320_c0_g1_i1.p1  ORF type:complete len:223 (+),score=60.10 TRINITY_DN3320_c0_g1_i1:50-718(+)